MIDVNFHGYRFTLPVPYTGMEAPNGGGVYAVMVTNALWMPSSMQPIYFGQTDRFYDRHVARQHLGYSRWMAHPGALYGLFISYHAMPREEKGAREFVESVLVSHYRPECNWIPREFDHMNTTQSPTGTVQEMQLPGHGLPEPGKH